ncbi:MAG: 50S ribosome-binding GTPase [Campylobacteraceae bacterium]|jgi:bifunctional enzyme CysN/CysC/sulfate adenylyltransferase subunit 1|nr:50S ribosome-binding GTPase [Campylobacteraceae bacterium]
MQIRDKNGKKERMDIVITGHVDHGKSTLVGRLLTDTASLPQGKLEGVKNLCEKNGRVFEYSMLLDALEDEQKQGITIDSARIFFKSRLREYVIIDAPGHIEFLRNMLSGASRAAAAVLVIDAIEGVAENSKRHGLLLSLLGISQVLVAINKLDALNYEEKAFRKIKNEYEEYLNSLHVKPVAFIPISAREGKNITQRSSEMSWYQGKTILEALDSFHNPISNEDSFFAMPLQDIYRFSDDNDNRRIYAGTIVSGGIKTGDFVKFLPSNKEAHIKNIEVWNAPVKTDAKTNEAVGFTLKEEIYVKNGEVMIKADETAYVHVSSKIRANLIWLGHYPLVFHKNYLFKLGCAKVNAKLEKIEKILGEDDKARNDLKKNECGSVILSLSHPIALSNFCDNTTLGRFVLVDNFDTVGGGIVLESKQCQNEEKYSFEDELFALLRKHFPHRFADENQILYQI